MCALSFWQKYSFTFFESRPESRLSGSYGNFILSYLRKLKCFKVTAPSYASISNAWRFQSLHVLPNICNYLFYFLFCFTYSSEHDRHFTVVLISSSPVTNDDHFFTCSLDIRISSLEKCIHDYLSIFNVGYLSFYGWVVIVTYIFWKQVFLLNIWISSIFFLCVDFSLS